jgi:signal transduction histidine kinase
VTPTAGAVIDPAEARPSPRSLLLQRNAQRFARLAATITTASKTICNLSQACSACRPLLWPTQTDGKLWLRVSDDGVGLTSANRAEGDRRGSIGLSLVDAPLRQLHATAVWSGPGTVFTAEFPVHHLSQAHRPEPAGIVPLPESAPIFH